MKSLKVWMLGECFRGPGNEFHNRGAPNEKEQLAKRNSVDNRPKETVLTAVRSRRCLTGVDGVDSICLRVSGRRAAKVRLGLYCFGAGL